MRNQKEKAFTKTSVKKAVVLLSGGLDSATVLAVAKSENCVVTAITFSYGQRHLTELNAAKAQALFWKVEEHLIAEVDFSPIGGSALTSHFDVPKNRPPEEIGKDPPITYVPARNAVFLSYGLAVAEPRGIREIFIGANAVDFSGYPDCRPEFIEAFEAMARTATVAGMKGENFRVRAPLLKMTKGEIIKLGAKLGVDYAKTWTCYDPDRSGNPCLRCESCFLRARGFEEASIPDPLLR